MTSKDDFNALAQSNGSNAIFHRDDASVPCPCLTPEGNRDPIWHILNPTEPVCNEAGMLPGSPIHLTVKAFVQPIQSTRATRLSSEILTAMFGEVQADDHLGIFPVSWAGVALNFYDWGRAGEDWVEYDGRTYTVVNANKLPGPEGMTDHHWEVALRLSK